VALIESDPVKFSHHLSGDELTGLIEQMEKELQMAVTKKRTTLIKPPELRKVIQQPERKPRVPHVNYGSDAPPFYVLRDWIAAFRDANPEQVFILNTDNARPFEADIPVYSPALKSQHLQIGVNEKLALNIARGIANAGGLPIYTTPATHLQVVAEDMLHCALAKDPVLLIGIFAGVDLAFWGPSHTSHRDVLLFAFPGVNVFQPATADDVRVILEGIYQNPKQHLPGYIRLPSMPFMKITETKLVWSNFKHAFTNGFYWFESELAGAVDVLFIASGISLKECLEAAAKLETHHIKCNVINVLNLQNLNGELLNSLARGAQHIISVIDADPSVMTNLLWRYLDPDLRSKIFSLGVSDFNERHYSKARVLAAHGIDAVSLTKLALGLTTKQPVIQRPDE